MNYPKLINSNKLIGMTVKNLNHEPVGVINELVINKVSGTIHYVVIKFGVNFGFGNKYFSFPWQSLKYCEDDYFTLDADLELLQLTTGFDKEQWPNFHAVDLIKYYQ